MRGTASCRGGLDSGKAQLGKKSFDSLLNVLVMFKIFLVTSSTDREGSDERHGGDAGGAGLAGPLCGPEPAAGEASGAT